MPLRIEDGYTLSGQTSGAGNAVDNPVPVVKFTYRPPLAREMANYYREMRDAKTGDSEHETRCKFILARLVSWDVELGRTVAPITLETLQEKIPEVVLLDLAAECAKWKPKPQEQAEKN